MIDLVNPMQSNIVGIKDTLQDTVNTLLEIAHCKNGGDSKLDDCFADHGPLDELKTTLMQVREIRLDSYMYKICNASNIKLDEV